MLCAKLQKKYKFKDNIITALQQNTWQMLRLLNWTQSAYVLMSVLQDSDGNMQQSNQIT